MNQEPNILTKLRLKIKEVRIDADAYDIFISALTF